MSGQFIQIQSNAVALSKERGFLILENWKDQNEEPLRIPLDRVEGVSVEATGVTLSKTIITELATRGIPLILNDQKHLPRAALSGFNSHHLHAEMINLQAALKLPAQKRLWKKIIQAKIENQNFVLSRLKGNRSLEFLIPQVKSGDSDNREGVAARIYWSKLLGETFVRDQNEGSVNSLLNFGYSILRSTMAKFLALSGLSPALGIYHRNARNPFRLVDDLMEPFRPAVDLLVHRMVENGHRELEPRLKSAFIRLWLEPIFSNSPWGRCANSALEATSRSYAKYLKDPAKPFCPCPAGFFPELFSIYDMFCPKNE
ncbi:MAG: type II CRISPR-associated endonuclease Cas1 [Opitutales bacterium]|nr:type II CRISPR-associated endonuclease Cas1 [Opitutales bacterium]MCH8541006.1 type II CRISPR-associated endonuclease Cas1 [Opitutales bacterium]